MKLPDNIPASVSAKKFLKSRKRYKDCPACGRKHLSIYDFVYVSKNEVHVGRRCNECRKKQHIRSVDRCRQRKREEAKGRIRIKLCRGHMSVYDGKPGAKSFFWSPSMLADLRRLFPVTRDADLVLHFGMCLSTVRSKARELGLRKDPGYLAEVAKANAWERTKNARVRRFIAGQSAALKKADRTIENVKKQTTKTTQNGNRKTKSR